MILLLGVLPAFAIDQTDAKTVVHSFLKALKERDIKTACSLCEPCPDWGMSTLLPLDQNVSYLASMTNDNWIVAELSVNGKQAVFYLGDKTVNYTYVFTRKGDKKVYEKNGKKIKVNGMRFEMKKCGGKWRISKVDTDDDGIVYYK